MHFFHQKNCPQNTVQDRILLHHCTCPKTLKISTKNIQRSEEQRLHEAFQHSVSWKCTTIRDAAWSDGWAFFLLLRKNNRKLKQSRRMKNLLMIPPPLNKNQQPHHQHKSSRKTADSDTHLSNFKFQAVWVSFLSHKTIQLHPNPRRHPKKKTNINNNNLTDRKKERKNSFDSAQQHLGKPQKNQIGTNDLRVQKLQKLACVSGPFAYLQCCKLPRTHYLVSVCLPASFLSTERFQTLPKIKQTNEGVPHPPSTTHANKQIASRAFFLAFYHHHCTITPKEKAWEEEEENE